MGIFSETVFGLSFQRLFDANLKRGLNDINSTGKDKLIKAQLVSLLYLKAKLNIDLNRIK